MKEVWVTIAEYEKYQVSNLGRVKKVPVVITRKDGVILHMPERIKRQSNVKVANGYLVTRLNNSVRGKLIYVHRLIAEAFIPNQENKKFINHIDGNKTNNSIGNLEWCSSSENNKHAIDTGLRKYKSGCDHRLSFLSKEDILDIRRLSKGRVKPAIILNKYHIKFPVYYNIIKRISYNNIPEEF